MAFPKINIGVSRPKKSLHNLSHDVNTTSSFGDVQPLVCELLIPDSTASLKVDSFVRLGAMPSPTFGRAYFKKYFRFVPINELFRNFDAFLTGQSYTTLNSGIYVPTEMPYFSNYDMLMYVLLNSHVSVFQGSVGSISLVTDITEVTNVLDSFSSTHFQLSSHYTLAGNNFTKYNHFFYTDPSNNGTFVSPQGADFNYSYTYQGHQYLLSFRFNTIGRKLRKLFIGLGFQLSLDTEVKKSMLPLFCFYRAYFDQFYPKRDQQFEQSNAYALIDFIVENDDPDFIGILRSSVSKKRYLFIQFMNDLAESFYYDDPNYFSAHITSQSTNNSNFELVGQRPDSSLTQLHSSNVSVGEDSQASLSGNSNLAVNATSIKLLDRLYSFVNKDSVLGKRIGGILSAHGLGQEYEVDSNYIGSDVINIQIGDVFSTAETSEGFLGEYAGKGIGSGSSDTFKFSNKEFGYLICLGVIVPKVSFVQGTSMKNMITRRFDFAHPEFDSLGMQVSPCAIVNDSSDGNLYIPSETPVTPSQGFGFIPRYSEYKYHNNILNGDLSRLGSRSDMLRFTLDTYFNNERLSVTPQSNPHNFFVNAISVNLPFGSNVYRRVGRDSWFGNFDRIFYNSGGTFDYLASLSDPDDLLIDDNFICHNVVDLRLYQPLKSMSDSFETFNEGDSSISVQHE